MLTFLRHIFLPHESNGHRPKILHHQSLAAFILIILSILYVVPPIQQEYPSVLGVSYSITVEDLVRLTNEKRKAAGLQPLTLNQELSSAARSKAAYMFEKNFWAHVAPDGTTPWYFIKNAGYEYQYAGENLARGFNTTEDVTTAWMESPTHRENLLSPNYSDIGFAISSGTLTGSETVLVVQEFGSKYTKADQVAAVVEPSSAPAPSIVTEEIKDEISVPKNESQSAVAASVNKPLIDSKSSTFNLSIFIFGLFIIILAIDAIYIERKKISRVFAHNFDHIIFLIIMSLAVIIMGRGVIL
ncbi:MAG TPA: CAP domain-containing protein [Candidatus Limnocylindrales bacterium]|nr:CAP domain-containing protein [Candidatus Limnocylindrales bacterium]